MKTKIERVYHCEFCNKISINKGAMTWHEKKCKSNPNNQHSCFGCKYLEVHEPINVLPEFAFTCVNKKCKFFLKELYTYKKDEDPLFERLTRMPTNCSHFKRETL